MNPTWVMQQPTGNETGKYLVLDLGGTNLRVFSVELTEQKSGFKVNQVTHKLPKELRTGPAERLWDFVAGHLEEFLKTADFEAGTNTDLSFIFSFPTTQRTIDEGILQRWTKGFDVADCEGRDVAVSLRHSIAKRVGIIILLRGPNANIPTETPSQGPSSNKRHNRHDDGLSIHQLRNRYRLRFRHRLQRRLLREMSIHPQARHGRSSRRSTHGN